MKGCVSPSRVGWWSLGGIALLALLVGSCGSDPSTSAADTGSTSSIERSHRAEVIADGSNVGSFAVFTSISFPGRRILMEATYDLPEAAQQVVSVIVDGREKPAQLPLTVAPGTDLSVVAQYGPDCGEPGGAPVLVVRTSDPSGDVHVEGFADEASEQFRDELNGYCGRGAVGTVTGSRQDVDGGFEVYLEVFNPGPGDLEFVSEAYETEDTRWFQVSTTIAASDMAELTIHGEGDGCTIETPWATGHLKVDGKPLGFPDGSGEQC